jgi:D-alanyl-D-alanine carboxypeptidase
MKLVLRPFLLFLCIALQARSASFDPTLAAQLQQTLDSMRAATNIKGVAACVFVPGQGFWRGAAGISHAGVPITPEMEFGIGSNTKLFTAALLLKLSERQVIDLGDSLHSYLPPLSNVNPNITIRQLLHHTSGLSDVTDAPGYTDSINANPYRIFTPAELIGWIGAPLYAPGNGWNYCNTNYLLAGMIAENATGHSYAQLLRDSILSSLQLDSTFLDVFENIPHAVAHPWQASTDNHSVPRIALNSAAWSAGAMYSTCGEMAQWYHALMNGQWLQPASFTEMTTFVGAGNYGMGISEAIVNGRTVWLHGGTIWGGYNSLMMYDTASGRIIAVLTNQLPGQALSVAAQLLASSLNFTVQTKEYSANEPAIQLFPNPANDHLQVCVGNQSPLHLTLMNALGKVLLTTNDPVISLSQLPHGWYLLKVQTSQKTFMGKFLRN